MSDQTQTFKRCLLELSSLVEECVAECGEVGSPSGHLYASLMGVLSLDQYEGLMSALVQMGKVEKRGDCFFAPERKVVLQ
jgi:hypothetical protein